MPLYGYQFKEGPAVAAGTIKSVGRERQTSNYDWYGLRRREDNSCVLQYTLSGWGRLEYGGDHYRVDPGQAFFLRTFSEYRYYLPRNSPGWEFVFISLRGEEVENCWRHLTNKHGPLLSFPPESPAIRLLKHIYQLASDKQIRNGYQAAGLAYQFIMELYLSDLPAVPDWPPLVQKAVSIMNEQFAAINGPEELSRMLGLSKFQLIKLFKKATGMTVVDYLTKVRIEEATRLLRESDLLLDEIAARIGYANGNYFNKVFRKKIGIAPGKFRKSDNEPLIDHITFD